MPAHEVDVSMPTRELAGWPQLPQPEEVFAPSLVPANLLCQGTPVGSKASQPVPLRQMSFRSLIVGLLLVPAFLLGDDPVVELRGKIIHVTDGDTVGILVGKETIKIRLVGIDAPEAKQSFGTKSKEALVKLVHGKDATVKKTGEDRYKRTLGTIYVGQTNVNSKMVEDGWAWHYKKYSKDEELAKLEVKARETKVGLWADPNPLAPWEFRAKQAAKNPAEPATAESVPSEPTTKTFWLNTSSNVRHNASCEHFNKTTKGRFCTSAEGKACGKCGG